MRFNARNSINFAAQLLRVKKGKVEEFLSNSIKLLYIWDFFLELPLTQFLIFLELLAYFKRQETLFASQFSKKFNDNWFLMRFSCLTKNCYENPSGLDFFSFISSGSRSSSSRQFEETRKCRYFMYKTVFSQDSFWDCLWCVIFSNYFQISSCFKPNGYLVVKN